MNKVEPTRDGVCKVINQMMPEGSRVPRSRSFKTHQITDYLNGITVPRVDRFVELAELCGYEVLLRKRGE